MIELLQQLEEAQSKKRILELALIQNVRDHADMVAAHTKEIHKIIDIRKKLQRPT